jgi:hypothetical protein
MWPKNASTLDIFFIFIILDFSTIVSELNIPAGQLWFVFPPKKPTLIVGSNDGENTESVSPSILLFFRLLQILGQVRMWILNGEIKLCG